MMLAIHAREDSFSDRWIAFCRQSGIDYKIVNAFDSDIIEKVKGCDAFLWHHHHGQFKDAIAAKKILFALEYAGVKVFPDHKTGWHFDDKVAQKYLLEAIDAPVVPSYIFYEKQQATVWARETTYPKVFKLKGGAGATNVKLVRTQREALRLIYRAFGRGFAQFDRINNLKERFNKFRRGQDTILGVLKGIARLFVTTDFVRMQCPEKGYAYFQDFMPGNDSDIRVIVIGEKAFAVERFVRPNDFRASGSGNISYDFNGIDKECLRMAFSVNRRLASQCTAFDFIFGPNRQPLIVEISYGFSAEAYDSCLGYWDSQLNWHAGQFNPQAWIIEGLLSSAKV